MRRADMAKHVLRCALHCKSIVTAGALAGAMMLLPSPIAAVAHADGLNWDAVAACESGGNWAANTGNGFYGGLQFKVSTWKEHGGTGSPADASRDEQIAVANRVMANQGPKAWPKCGHHAGNVPAPAQWQRPLQDLAKTLWSALPH